MWLPLYGAVVLGLLCWRVDLSVPPSLPAVVGVSLASFEPPEFRPLPGPAPGPPGGSNRKGNDAIDARLLTLPALDVIEAPPTRVLPVVEPEFQPSAPPLIVDKSLPVVPGGNGVPRGDGLGFGRGHGDGVGNGTGQGGRGILKLVKSVAPDYSHDPALSPIDGQRVKVCLQVGKDGVPFDARVVSAAGYEPSFPATLKVALAWRFQVPKGFASRAPFEVFVDFTYRQDQAKAKRPGRSTQVSEVAPIVVE
ncbi:hypothetical protein [Geothrix sp. PMB-07]|uniref:hypothetical protein n=1 Tax=Geothrix sp. PMB-07 TaxID=3068640 RepID=UPI00274181AA|nr:hypothetical protein [Geothrix sp. PMB-07]WLT32103.1 hypothetical protein Q9293_01995 [Geothrix sp. PMB-07]